MPIAHITDITLLITQEATIMNHNTILYYKTSQFLSIKYKNLDNYMILVMIKNMDRGEDFIITLLNHSKKEISISKIHKKNYTIMYHRKN